MRRVVWALLALGGCGTLVPYSAAPLGLAASVVPESPASAVVVTAAAAAPGLGGRASLSGRVVDLTTGAPVAGAEIQTAGDARTTSGADGRFQLARVDAGALTVVAEAPGYALARSTVRAGRDSLTTLLVVLRADGL